MPERDECLMCVPKRDSAGEGAECLVFVPERERERETVPDRD